MSAVLDQWLGDSRHAIHSLEQEVSAHQIAIQNAMAQIRDHTAMINHLQHHLEIIRRATTDVDSGLGESEFEQSFHDAFAEQYDELEAQELCYSEPILPGAEHEHEHAYESAPEEDTSVNHVQLRVMNGEAYEPEPARARLPPPPPHHGRRRR